MYVYMYAYIYRCIFLLTTAAVAVFLLACYFAVNQSILVSAMNLVMRCNMAAMGVIYFLLTFSVLDGIS